jgi:hypothetical protein
MALNSTPVCPSRLTGDVVRLRTLAMVPGFVLTGYPEVETDGRGGATMILLGETEAGSAGTQPCRGITWWAHRDDK